LRASPPDSRPKFDDAEQQVVLMLSKSSNAHDRLREQDESHGEHQSRVLPIRLVHRREPAAEQASALKPGLYWEHWHVQESIVTRAEARCTFEFPSLLLLAKLVGSALYPIGPSLAHSSTSLTDDEGTFLALLVRIQPATAYQLSRVYEESPVSNFGTSKGKIYPLVRRLKERGFIKARPVQGDARGSECLECTRSGREAVRRWVKHIRPAHLLLEDPLRTMIQSFDLLSLEEQSAWIENAERGLRSKLEQLETYRSEVTVPYKDQAHDNAVSSVLARLEWLGRLRRSILQDKKKDRAAKRGFS
jgi:DNA-binding PadR family transcriptional regulator